MSLSRLRLRLGAWFAIAYLAGLLALDLSLYAYLRVQADHRFTRDLQSRGAALIDAVLGEMQDLPDSGLGGASREAMREWQALPGRYQVMDSAGLLLAERGTSDSVPPGEGRFREVVVRHPSSPRFEVTVSASTAALQEDTETLAWWLGLSAPLVLLLGLAGGYVLSRRALAPIDELGDAIAGISPESLGSRLSLNAPADEIDRVRVQFNALLDRLERAQLQNRKFLRQAAHQIRTPLTLVMGEASLELPRAQGAGADVLRRIQLAAEQMQRRVDDLFLLAEAQAGATPPLDEEVELDGLLLEVADAMRGRAQQLGQQLSFGEVAEVTAAGNRGLLREAVLELLENAVRHGTPGTPIELTLIAGAEIRLSVTNAGKGFTLTPEADDPLGSRSDRGLGLQIVQWIMRLHRGRVEVAEAAGNTIVALVLPQTR